MLTEQGWLTWRSACKVEVSLPGLLVVLHEQLHHYICFVVSFSRTQHRLFVLYWECNSEEFLATFELPSTSKTMKIAERNR